MGVTTVAVTGASGFVGRHVVRTLLERGRRVRALVRDPDKASRTLPVDSADLTLVRGSLADASAMRHLMEGASGVIHTVGIIRERSGGQTFQRVHVLGTRRVLDACAQAGVGRIVHISALGVRDEGSCAYQRTKFEAEMLVRSSRMRWTILRPSMILGEGSEFIEMASGWLRGRRFPYAFVPYFRRHVGGAPIPGIGKFEDAALMPVDIRDVAKAAAESLDRPEAHGEVIPLVGSRTMTMPEMMRELREHVPLAKISAMIGVPSHIAAVQARVGGWLGLKYLLPFDEGMALMAGEDSTADATRQRAILGIEPSDCARAIEAGGAA